MNYLTVADLVRYATEQARIERIDYFDPRYARQDEIRAWQTDCRRRSAARRKVFTDWCGLIERLAAPVSIGALVLSQWNGF